MQLLLGMFQVLYTMKKMRNSHTEKVEILTKILLKILHHIYITVFTVWA